MTDEVKGPVTGFKRWHWLGYTDDLLPVIPVHAKLKEGSSVLPSMRGKTPGRRTAAGEWYGLTGKWSDELHPTVDDLKEWQGWGAAVGRQGRETPGLDIDSDDAAIAGSLEALARTHLGPAPVRSRQGSARCLLAYRGVGLRKVRLAWKTPDGASHAVELLGKGQYFNLEGEHPKGGFYEWDRYVKRDELTPIGSDEVEAYFAAARRYVESIGGVVGLAPGSATTAGTRKSLDDATLHAPRPQLVLDALAAFPCDADNFPTRDDFVRFLPAVKASLGATRDEHFSDVMEWALEYPGAEPAYIEKIWHSITDAQLGWSFLESKVGGTLGAQEAFGGETERKEPAIPETPFDRMLTRFVYVHQLGRYIDLKNGQPLTRQDFNALNTRVAEFGLSGIKAADAVFQNAADARKVPIVTYRPGREPVTEERLNGTPVQAVNSWRPSRLVPARGVTAADVRPWLELLDQLALPEDREHLLDWMAFNAQRAGEKINHAVVVLGAHGIGKDSLFHPLLRLVGEHNVAMIQPEALTTGFNPYMKSQLVVVQEMMNFSRREITNKLKPYLAAPPEWVEINEKHVKPYPIPNLTNWIFFTNHDDAIALEEGDRRFWIMRCQWEEKTDREALWKWYNGEAGGFEKVAGFLLARDIRSFKPHAPPPETEAKREMLDHSMPPGQRWLSLQFEDGGEWQGRTLISVGEMMEAARASSSMKVAEGTRERHATAALRQAGFKTIARKVKIGKAVTRLWTRHPRPGELEGLDPMRLKKRLDDDRANVEKNKRA